MFLQCRTAKNEAQQKLRSTAEQLEQQRAENINVYGLNTRLSDQLERVQLTKDKELKELGDECEVLRDTSESLQLELANLRAQLDEAERDERAKQAELESEREAHAASLIQNEKRIVELKLERAAFESQSSQEAARLADANNAELTRVQRERDTAVHTLDVTTHTVIPRVIDKFTREARENMDKVHRLDAKYAQLSREMEARSREMATRSAELNEEKNEFVETFTKQCDGYKAMADALRDRSLQADLSTILKSIGVSTEPEQEAAPESEPITPDEAASDKLKSLSLYWRRN